MMKYVDIDDPLAVATVKAIHAGDRAGLRRLLDEHEGLASVRLREPCGMSRTLLHVVTDWPGHFPNGVAIVAALVTAGADVNARFMGRHAETPLHWAASSNDVAVLDALLDAGADIEATGAVIGGGTPLSDARGFGQWKAACRLVERGACTTLNDAATLGLMDRVIQRVETAPPPTPDEVTRAFWGACHGGQREVGEYLLARGADVNGIGHGGMTPLDIARASAAEGLTSAADLEPWLRNHGAEVAALVFSVRRAVEDDASTIALVLRQAFAEYEQQYTADAFAATVPDASEIRTRWEEGPVWIGLRANDIVGTVAAVPTDRGFYIRSMAVAPEARRHGLADRLLEHVERFARQHSAARLFLSTTPFLPDAISFYERLGFRRTSEGPHPLFGTPLFTMEKLLSERRLPAHRDG